MGFVLLGIATLTTTGVNGALFANIAHGLITGLLFFLVGAVKERLGTSSLDDLAGSTGAALYGRAPRLGGLLAFAAVASLGLPGLAGFWGEMLSMFGAFKPAAGLSRPAYVTYTAIAAFGTLLTAAYLLTVVRRVCMGEHQGEPVGPHAGAPGPGAAERGASPVSGAERGGAPTSGAAEPGGAPTSHAAVPAVPEPVAGAAGAGAGAGLPGPVPDIRGYEFAAWTPLAVLTVVAGLWPAVLLGLTTPAVRSLLGGS
jgi:NADH-quinone oxidoreductase subunit M